jgi:hypothetical protein
MLKEIVMPHHVTLFARTADEIVNVRDSLARMFPEVISNYRQGPKRVSLLGKQKYALHLMFAQTGQEALECAETMAGQMAQHMFVAHCVSKLEMQDDTKRTSKGERIFGRFFILNSDPPLNYRSGCRSRGCPTCI